MMLCLITDKIQDLVHNRRSRAILFFLLSIIIMLIYLPVLQNGFVPKWDDEWMVLDNPHLEQVSFVTLKAIFTEPYEAQYSPLIILVYAAIKHFAGSEAFAFHLFSLLVHLCNFILVGIILKKLLSLIPDHSLTEGASIWVAWGTAFLFAIHPLQVESVAWISASKIVLYGFFYLLGLWFYLIYRQSGKHFYLVIVLLCFLCSLFTKEQAVVFVFSLMAVDLATDRKSLSKKNIWLEKVPFLIIALFYGWFTLSISVMPGTGETYPLWQRVPFGNYSFWEYLIKLLVPHNLSHFYFFPMDIGEALPPRFWFYTLATAFFLWILIKYWQHINQIYLFGGFFFLINIVLVLHFIPLPRATIIADRYVYLSTIGFILVVIYAFGQWMIKIDGWKRRAALAATSIYLLILVGYTHQRLKAWKNMETLNQDVEQAVEKHMGDADYLRNMRTKTP